MIGNDPDDDRGNRALDYANDNLDAKLAAMNLKELCAEFDIGRAEGLGIFDEYYSYNGLRNFCLIVAGEARDKKCAAIELGIIELAEDGALHKRLDEMLCTAIRANPEYRERMSEKMQEQHRAGEVSDWMAQDDADERARERDGGDE